ncbi:putative rho1 guanine nucleotide exchange factor 3 [Podospora australis]|uniref:Rho1 guanine nucleotide exchange factor 3 n=1 Tax=Podospora australis TaxID=1536484 RepID=A0AAN7ANM4_9PEZI|nr:putative rho1 guanine nucleotide exchange factor 3 [Podospora australis]
MAFRGDESRRYGHVPPAQYPVAGSAQQQHQYQHQQQQQQLVGYPQRRPSFNDGDDQEFFDQNAAAGAARPQPLFTGSMNAGRGEEELFITSPTVDSQPPLPPPPNRASYMPPSANNVGTGYQRQYPGQVPPPPPSHSTYNPQQFARSQSTSLPYHPSPGATRYTPTASPTYTTPPTNYTPQAYNPAAYANTQNALPQRHSTVAGYNNNYGYNYSSSTNPHVSAAYAPPPSSTYGASQAPLAIAAPPPLSSGYDSPQYVPPASSAPYETQFSTSYGGQQYTNTYTTNGTSTAQSHVYPTQTAQVTPYPTHSQIPVGPVFSPDPSSFTTRASRSGSYTSPIPSPPMHNSQSTQISRHPTNAPLPSRPNENVIGAPDWRTNGRTDGDVRVTQDSLIQDIVSDLGISHGQRPLPVNGAVSEDSLDSVRRYGSNASNSTAADHLLRNPSNASSMNTSNNDISTTYNWDSEESDPEGAAGLLAMQDDLDDRRFGGVSFPGFVDSQKPSSVTPPAFTSAPAPTTLVTTSRLPPPAEEQASTDSDYGGMDLGMYGGGYAGNLHYGHEVGSPPATASTPDAPRPLPTPQSRQSEYPPFSEVSVDYAGTGGLQQPQAPRLSFDEGDERVSLHSRQSGSDSPSKEDYPYDQMFWHPGLSNRPLPALPPTPETSSTAHTSSALAPQPLNNRVAYQHNYSLSVDSRPPYPPDNHELYPNQHNTQQHVERSISLSSHSNTPPVQAPARSRTDAAEERRRAQKQLQHQHHPPYPQGSAYDGYDTGTPSTIAGYDMITLPTGRRKKFVPSKLTSADIKRCAEPWAISGITAWIREMAEGEPDLKRKTIEEGVLKLFCAKVPTMNVADAELLSASVVDSMFAAGILIPEEEWVKFGAGEMSGVLWQLTGSGCYAPKLHEDEGLAPRLHDNGIPVRCYSHHCGRTLKKVNLDSMLSEEDVVIQDWATFHGVTMEDVKSKHKKEVERQNVLHEIVTGEEDYMNQLDVLRLLYRDQLRVYQPPIIATNKLDKFLENVFGKVDAVQQINKENLLSQMKYRQQEQGPWIVGFSDLFREWIRKAKPIYIQYCSQFPYATYLIRREASKNLFFRQFLDMVRDHKRSKRLEWTTFVKAPITRLQRYGLLLETVKKNMLGESEEKANLERALEEIKAVTHECDEKVAEMTKKVELIELGNMLVLRPGFQSVLNLDHLGRELLKQGELQRQGSRGVRWVDTHAFLFDHYFILAKTVPSKDGRGDKKFDVSKEPIPMPLLFLESLNDDPVAKQKSLTAPLTRTTVAANSGTQLNKVISNVGDRPGLEHTATSSSTGSRLGPNVAEDGKIIYPFRIKHLGHEIYTLYAASAQDRATWCQAIIEAKTRHARALHAQNAEPFRLRIISDGAFAYDSTSPYGRQPSVSIRGTPLDRAIREMEKIYGPGRGPPPVCRATVNCACAFTAFGKSMIAIGTDYGVYISDASNPRGWTRTVQISKVTQIAVLEEFSVCLLIADKSLISYPLDVVAPVSNFPAPSHDNPRRAPQRLAKDVAFFATARMKDRMLLFYKRKEGMHNTFKVLEPVFQKATEKKSRLFGGRRGTGSTESFRDYDEFYIPAECYSLNLFQSYIAVASAKGFELLTLDKKQPQSIPRDLSLPAIANIASRIAGQRPLGMFKLNDQEFLLTYEDCAVYVDKHGEISRTLIMEYSGKQKKASAATMFGQYLLLFNEDYVEVRNAENGRLRQIIAGRDVRCLDYGFRGPTGSGGGLQPPPSQDSKGTVKICMSHPEVPGGQIVLEMLLNDGHTEKAT